MLEQSFPYISRPSKKKKKTDDDEDDFPFDDSSMLDESHGQLEGAPTTSEDPSAVPAAAAGQEDVPETPTEQKSKRPKVKYTTPKRPKPNKYVLVEILRLYHGSRFSLF